MSVTIRDVAKRAGVGVGTVSRVLNEHTAVREATRQKVLDVIQELDYTPNQTARRLSTGKTMSIGVIAPFFTAPSVVERLRGIESVIQASPYDLVIFNVENAAQTRNRFQTLYSGEKVDGLIIISAEPSPDDAKQFSKSDIPFVVVDADVPEMYCVCINDVMGGFLVTQHLAKLGHRHIAYISDLGSSREGNNSTAERFQGYQEALASAAIPFKENLVVRGEHSRHGGYEMTYRLLHETDIRPTAIVCASDTHAMGALQAASELNINVPYELSIIGYDDIEMAEYLNLTTLRQPLFDSGVTGAELLLQVMKGDVGVKLRHVLPTQLVVRGTTTRAPKTQ